MKNGESMAYFSGYNVRSIRLDDAAAAWFIEEMGNAPKAACVVASLAKVRYCTAVALSGLQHMSYLVFNQQRAQSTVQHCGRPETIWSKPTRLPTSGNNIALQLVSMIDTHAKLVNWCSSFIERCNCT